MTASNALVLGRPLLHEGASQWLAARYRLVETDDPARVAALIADADALYAYPPLRIDAALIERGQRLRVIAAAGSGVDHIDVAAAQRHGVAVTHAVGAGALSVAEHVIGQMIALAKQFPAGERAVREGRFEMRWNPAFREISGGTLAIVGYGAIGCELARIAKTGFGMRVVAVTRSGAVPNDAYVDAVLPLRDALRQADCVSVHTPLTAQTRGLIGREELACMKPGAWLVDTSRGGVVDSQALFEALQGGPLAGAALDVFDPEPPPADAPLLSLPNVLVSPHCAGMTQQALQRLAMAAARDIDAALRGERPAGLVDTAAWPASRAARAAFQIPLSTTAPESTQPGESE